MAKVETEITPAREAGEASYSVLARVINAVRAPDPPVTRNRVYEWAERHTANKAGEPFPEPARVIPAEFLHRGQPSKFWNVAAVLAWVDHGMPE